MKCKNEWPFGKKDSYYKNSVYSINIEKITDDQ